MVNKTRTVQHLEDLLATAAKDKKVRDSLVLGLAEGHQSGKADLTQEDLNLIESIREDLLRFGGNPDLHPDDARSWALGVLISATSRVRKDRWVVHVESIRRDQPVSNASRPKKKKGR